MIFSAVLVLTLSAALVHLIIGTLIPFVTAFLTHVNASPGVKQLVTAVLAAIGAALTTATQVDGTAVISKLTIILAIANFLEAQIAYKGLYEPHNLNGKVAPSFGIGRPRTTPSV